MIDATVERQTNWEQNGPAHLAREHRAAGRVTLCTGHWKEGCEGDLLGRMVKVGQAAEIGSM